MRINLREKAKSLEPIVRIGKLGITDGIVQEINRLLSAKKLIKVKFLSSALDTKNKKELVKELVEKTGAELVEAVGFIAVLHKGDAMVKR